MKLSAVIFLALACVVALATAQYPGYAAQSGGGDGFLLPLIGLLFLVMLLFNNNNSSNTITLVNQTR